MGRAFLVPWSYPFQCHQQDRIKDAIQKKKQEEQQQRFQEGAQAQARGPPARHSPLWVPRRGQDDPPQADPPQQGRPQGCRHRQRHG